MKTVEKKCLHNLNSFILRYLDYLKEHDYSLEKLPETIRAGIINLMFKSWMTTLPSEVVVDASVEFQAEAMYCFIVHGFCSDIDAIEKVFKYRPTGSWQIPDSERQGELSDDAEEWLKRELGGV
jgi:hypothetical protein